MTIHWLENEIVAMLRDGHSGKAVARELHVSTYHVYAIRDAHNIPNWYADPNGPACRHGHPWPEHLAHYRDGKHYCRECSRLQHRRARTDDLAVELAVAGQPVRLRRPRDRRQAVRQMLDRNLTGDEMANRIGCTPRTIWRIRKELREAA